MAWATATAAVAIAAARAAWRFAYVQRTDQAVKALTE
jgi:hypothetical protein